MQSSIIINKIRQIPLTVLLILLIDSCSGVRAQDSRNGYWLPPYDTLRIFLVFAELKNDPYVPRDDRQWKTGEIPPDPGFLFDYNLPPGQAPKGIITKYYHEASFGKYVVLADYYPEMISIEYEDVKGNGFDQAINAILDNNKEDIITRHGYSVRAGDFDYLTTSRYGIAKEIQPDSLIDMIFIIWRGNSKITKGSSAGYCLPSQRSYPILNMKGMNSSSLLVMKELVSFTIVRHEFSHLLLGGNNFHTGGPGAGVKTFMSSAGGYAMLSSWDRSSPVYSSFDRRRLGWKAPGNLFQISARDPLSGNEVESDLIYNQEFPNGSGEFILRDFVQTGDALRIKLPYVQDSSREIKNQWLWLENHQKPEGLIDHEQNSSKGIYAYIQVGKEELTGTGTYQGTCNYTWPLSAFGNFDFMIDELTEESAANTEWMNPFTGINTLIRGAYDLGDKDGFIQREETFLSKKLKFNGEYLDPSLLNFENYTMWGTAMDAFQPGQEIGIDRNPAAVPLLTWRTGYSSGKTPRSPAADDNRIIHLNGISVKILEQLPDGSMKVRIQWDERNIERNLRWCGEILVHEDISIEKGVQVRIDQGLSPQKPSEPVRLNGAVIFSDPSIFSLSPEASISMGRNSGLIIENKSSLELAAGSRILMERGSKIIIADSCSLKIYPGAEISGKGKIYISETARSDFDKDLVRVRIIGLKE